MSDQSQKNAENIEGNSNQIIEAQSVNDARAKVQAEMEKKLESVMEQVKNLEKTSDKVVKEQKALDAVNKLVHGQAESLKKDEAKIQADENRIKALEDKIEALTRDLKQNKEKLATVNAKMNKNQESFNKKLNENQDLLKNKSMDFHNEGQSKLMETSKSGCTNKMVSDGKCIDVAKPGNEIGFTGWIITRTGDEIDCKFIGNQKDGMLKKQGMPSGYVGALNPGKHFVDDLFNFTFAQHGIAFQRAPHFDKGNKDLPNLLQSYINDDGALGISKANFDAMSPDVLPAFINEIHHQMREENANRFSDDDAGKNAFKIFRLQPLSSLIIENSFLTYENLFIDPATKEQLIIHNENAPQAEKIDVQGATSYDYKDFKDTPLWKEVLLKQHNESTLQRKDGKQDKALLEGDMLIYVGQTYNPVSAHTVGLGEHDKNCWYSTAHRTVFSDDGWYQKISKKDGGKTASLSAGGLLGGGGGKYFYENHQNIEIGYGWTWASQGSQAFGGKKTKKRRRQRTLKEKKNRKSKKKYSKKRKSKK